MGRSTDYSNCYIYYIVDKDGVIHYVGSTSNMNSRKSCHKYRCNTEKDKNYNLDIYRYIRDHGGFDNFEITPIKKIENISNKTELRIAEQQEINKFSGLKNKIGSYLSEEERVIQNIERCKKHYEENKEQRREYQSKYNEKNKEKVNEYKRQWQKNNPEKRNQHAKKYREANKEKINENQRKYRQQKKELKQAEQ